MKIKQGILCTVEGIDGCGKSTFIKNLEQKLASLDLPAFTTKEPGKTELGKQLRSILMNRSAATCSLAEFFLFAADRAQHFEEFVIPHLQEKHIIISDRMATSSMVYQGYLKGLNRSMIEYVNTWAMQSIQPHIIFYLKLDPETALQRIVKRSVTEKSVAFEEEILSKQQELAHGFDEALKNKPNVVILDANQSPEKLAQEAIYVILRKVEIVS